VADASSIRLEDAGLVRSRQAGGLPAISRWSSAASTTGGPAQRTMHPGGMPDAAARETPRSNAVLVVLPAQAGIQWCAWPAGFPPAREGRCAGIPPGCEMSATSILRWCSLRSTTG